MAIDISILDLTYAGEALPHMITKAITGADTLDGGHAYIQDGIKKKFTIPRLYGTYDAIIQDHKPTPTPVDTGTVDGNVLTPAIYDIYAEFDPLQWSQYWYAFQQQAQLMGRELPPSASYVIVEQYLKFHAKYLNKLLWNGSTTLTNSYKYIDGFLKKIYTGSGTVLVGSPTTLSASNIFAEFLRGYELIPTSLRYDPDMKFFCSPDVFDFYDAAQIAQTYKGKDVTEVSKNMFKRHEVVLINDMPADTYVIAKGMATPESNLWVGMNSKDDDASLKFMPLQANSTLWFLKMIMKVDVQCGFFEEIVYYGPAVS